MAELVEKVKAGGAVHEKLVDAKVIDLAKAAVNESDQKSNSADGTVLSRFGTADHVLNMSP